MKYSFDKFVDRRNTHCIKYDGAKQVFGREDIIPLWIADSDFEVAPFITEAIRRRAEHPLFGYTFRGEEFGASVCDWVKRRNGWEMSPEWVGFSPGVVAGFSLAILAVTEESDGVVIQPPVYPPFARMIRTNGRKLLRNPLCMEEGRYEIDFDDFERQISRSKAFLMCNPHNPTGRVFTRKELQRMGELCVRYGVTIISDEIHSDLIHAPHRHIHIASLSEEIARHTITLFAPSKTFNIAGLSSSVSVIPDETLRKRFQAEIDRVDVGGGNIFGNVAMEAAYREGDEWLDQENAYIAGNAQYVVNYLQEHIPSVKSYLPESTFLLWMDFREWGMEPDELNRFLVEKAGLGLSNGRDFGAEGIGFMRMNLATRRTLLEEAMKRLSEVDKQR